MTILRWIILAGGALALIGASARADRLYGNIVTYSDFNRISYVASSMSRVYFATSHGITRYQKMEDRWLDPLTGGMGIDHEDIQKVWVDVFDQRLVASTSTGLFEHDPLLARWFSISQLPSMEMSGSHVAAPEILFVPDRYTAGAEGYLVDPLGRYYYFSDVLDDGSGRLWLGTWGLGAATAGSATASLELLPFGLLQLWVGVIEKHRGELLVAGPVVESERTGISVLDIDENSFRYFESGLRRDFPDADINCLVVYQERLYAGTPLGLLCLDFDSGQPEAWYSSRNDLSHDNVLSLAAVGDSLFVGTEQGLSVVTFGRDTARYIRPDQFRDLIIYDLAPVDSEIWIATSAGAYRLRIPSGQLQRLEDPELLVTGDVVDIDVVERDLWLLSPEGALRLDRENGDYQALWDVAGTRSVTCLAADDELLAVGSNGGLTLTTFAEKKPHTVQYTTQDGLPSDYVLDLLADGDYLWVGTDRGLSRVAWKEL